MPKSKDWTTVRVVMRKDTREKLGKLQARLHAERGGFVSLGAIVRELLEDRLAAPNGRGRAA